MTSKERYWHRKRNRLCVWCEAGLQPEDTTHCVECTEKRRDSHARYNETRPRKRRERTPEQCVRDASRTRKRRQAKIETGRCAADGCSLPPVPGERRCKACRLIQRDAAREWWRRSQWALILARNIWMAGVAPFRKVTSSRPNGRLPPEYSFRRACNWRGNGPEIQPRLDEAA